MNPTFSSLPTELQDSILSHTLTLPFPIKFDPAPPHFHASYSHPETEVQKILEIIRLLPSSHETFFRQNTFHVSNDALSTFLAYTPSSLANHPSQAVASSPRNHITHLRVNMQPMIGNVDVPSLRELLRCPRLKKVEIEIADLVEGLRSFDSTFYQIKDACLELGRKLGGDEWLSVGLTDLYGKGKWTMQDFKTGVPP
ncbi:MAG: hypothetical protein Q9169_008622, partial [Polycauliona sp. 2 TL-2023]